MARAVLLVFTALASLGAALGDGCWLDCNQADADGAAAICASEGGALCSPYEMLADEATRSTSECDMSDYAWTDDDSFTWSSASLSWSCGAGERLACVSNGHPASTDCACYDESTQLDVRCCNCDGNDYAMAACLRCVNRQCEGNEPHSEICSDCFGYDCDECGAAVGESERQSFVRGGCSFDDGSEVGNWFRDEGCGSLRGCYDEDSCTPGWRAMECLNDGTVMYAEGCSSCDDCSTRLFDATVRHNLLSTPDQHGCGQLHGTSARHGCMARLLHTAARHLLGARLLSRLLVTAARVCVGRRRLWRR